MDPLHEHWTLVSYACWMVGLLIDTNQTVMAPLALEDNDILEEVGVVPFDLADAPLVDTFIVMTNIVNNYRLICPSNFLSEEVHFWVKLRSMTWFCKFLVDQYDNSRWLLMFRMMKTVVFALADVLKPHVAKKNTRYRLAIPVVVRMACTLFKLTHGANLTICSEMFAIGRSTCCKVLREVVCSINETLKGEISWPIRDRVQLVQSKFVDLYSLLGVVGAIDGMQIAIAKPDFGAADYYYFKSGGYSMNCQAIVDSEKRFLDLYVGMPGSTNDSRMLRRSSLYHLANHGNLMTTVNSVEGHTPYVIGDQGYPLLPWLMVPHRGRQQLSISETMFNRKLRKGRTVVENAFGILKQSFRELLDKSDLHLTFLPDVVVCCAILYNLLLRQSHQQVKDLLRQLHSEGLQPVAAVDEDGVREDIVHGDATSSEDPSVICDDTRYVAASQKRAKLEVFLATRCRPQVT